MRSVCFPAREARHRVTIQKLSTSSDGQGGQTESWITLATAWAKIEPLRGNELYRANAMNAEISHLVTVRYNSSITAAHRVLFGSRILSITGIINVSEANVMLELTCNESTPGLEVVAA